MHEKDIRPLRAALLVLLSAGALGAAAAAGARIGHPVLGVAFGYAISLLLAGRAFGRAGRHELRALLAAVAFGGSPTGTAAFAQETVPPARPGAGEPAPFAFADFSWVNGNYGPKNSIFDSKVFTGELRVDTNYVFDFNHPGDHTIDGSCEVGRSNEVQLQQLGIGGDFHWHNVRARLMTQFGMYSQMTPRNDSSTSRGQWNLGDAYRNVSEAYGGYHVDGILKGGVNVDAGIFMSYVGLFSYYNFDNWAYQPSYVSANTPWFFNGVRLQGFPSEKLKVELWVVNGWQSYGKFNESPGIGLQALWRPTGSIEILSNNYWGADALGNGQRQRFHTDDSFLYKYLDAPGGFLDRAALSLTVDAGCETGGGVSCGGGSAQAPSQYFLGFMLYNRFWFEKDTWGLTIGGGAITNPGRYLVLLPPINGATAGSGTPYFTQNPGDAYEAYDASITLDYMPEENVELRLELNHRGAAVPYFVGSGGITPPGGNQGAPGSFVEGWQPDLRKTENRMTLALLVRM